MSEERQRPVLLIRNEFELEDLITSQGLPRELVLRDFALMMIAASLVTDFESSLCFKGGFVLRHVYGHERFSKDIDATRVNPPKNKLDAADVAATIRSAGLRNGLTLDPGEPETDTGRSLDFNSVRIKGPYGTGAVAVEVSYREAVVLAPSLVKVGPPYLEPFHIPVMQLEEIVAEKFRTLAQRFRPTDLSDLAMIAAAHEVDEGLISRLIAKKFELVKGGNRLERVEEKIEVLGAEYETAVRAVAPDAPDYDTAATAIRLLARRVLK